MLEEKGILKVSSSFLARSMNLTASQVRQDFCNFGEFGQQGYGYDVIRLKNEILKILGLTKRYSVIILGAGNIGRALAGYGGFLRDGFEVKAVFDEKSDIELENGLPLLSMDSLQEYVKQEKPDIAVIAVPGQSAYEVAKKAVDFGIKSLWNFAPIDLKFDGVCVENIFMSDSLYVLAYKMNH